MCRDAAARARDAEIREMQEFIAEMDEEFVPPRQINRLSLFDAAVFTTVAIPVATAVVLYNSIFESINGAPQNCPDERTNSR